MILSSIGCYYIHRTYVELQRESLMKLMPTYDHVVVYREPPEEQTAGGLHIPATAQKDSNIATVAAVGPGKLLPSGGIQPMTVAVGDTVLLTKWSGAEFKHHKVPHLIVRESEILAVLREDE